MEQAHVYILYFPIRVWNKIGSPSHFLVKQEITHNLISTSSCILSYGCPIHTILTQDLCNELKKTGFRT